MKNFKLTKGIQIVVVTILLIILGIIIVGFFLNNEVMAKECPTSDCNGGMSIYYTDSNYHYYQCITCERVINEAHSTNTSYDWISGSTHSYTKKCTICGYTTESGTGSCNYYSVAVYKDENYHTRYCNYCKQGKWFSHEDEDEDGVCDQSGCGYSMHTHSYSSKTVDNGDGTHSVIKTCSCGDSYTASTSGHTWGSYSSDGNGHSAKCTACSAQNSGSHEGATHSNGGKCTVCKTTYQTHSKTTTVKEYKKSASGHTAVYTCSYSGCTGTYDGTQENHTGGTHDNDGKCALAECGYQYQTHEQSTTIKEYKKSENGHTPVYKCTESSCTITFDGTQVNHTGATHQNGGICTVEGCGYKYQTHEQTTTIKEYKKSASGHTPVYTCSHSGCTVTFDGTEANHTGGTHQNEGICTVSGCGYQYQTHGQSTTIKEYKKSENGHTPVYKCTESSCTITFDGTEAKHTGATHENGGICTVEGCGYQYETHEQTNTIKEYKKSASGHTPVYTCSHSECTETFDGTEAKHTGGTHGNEGVCTVSGCGYKYQTHGQSTKVKEYETTGTTHTPVYECTEPSCSLTYVGQEENHKDGNHENEGVCSVCKITYQTHKRSSTILEYIKLEEGHVPVYACEHSGCSVTYADITSPIAHIGGIHENDGECTVCEYKYQTHSQSTTIKEYKKSQTGHTPVYKCTEASCSTTYDGTEANHTGATHENTGICTVEGCGYLYDPHNQSTTIKEYKKTNTGHAPLYKCTNSNCEEIYEGEEDSHFGGTHENEGICAFEGCGYKYQTHEKTIFIKEYRKTEETHTPIYYCRQPGCSETYEGTASEHKGATHENGGKCVVEGCGYQYEPHSPSETIKEYKVSETGHTPVYTCTYSGCTGTYDGQEEAHTGATHENDGKCTVEGCGYQYEKHGQSNEMLEYKTTSTGHTPVYKCTHENCEATYDGQEEAHTGATHQNGGICTVEGCGYQYELHDKSNEIKEYKAAETGHTPVYKCTFEGCEETFEGEEEAHTGATHENEGKCTVEGCGYQYEIHGKTNIVKEYKTTQTGHTAIYACSKGNCETTYEGEEEEHTGATHENGGICTVEGCGYQYDPHGRSTTVISYEATAEGHRPIYGCTAENCEKTYKGELENHIGGTHENEGKCTVEGCGYQYQEHGKSTTIKGYKKSAIGHTPVYKCTHEDCETTYDGEEEEHTGATHENGGKCTVEGCGYQYKLHKKSTTIKEYDSTEEGHTPIYKCTNEDCEETFKGEEKEHTVEKWKDKGNGKHSGKCTICDYEVIDFHNYKDGECEDCKAEQPKEKCEHIYEKENDKNNHWEECTKCGEEKEGTKEPHNYEKYKDNEDGTHSSTCTECEYKLTEPHNYKDGECEDCKAEEPKKECEHTYVPKKDKDYHWEECSKCGETKEGSKKPHNYKEYKDNKDGTHSSTCEDCKYEMTEKHKTDGTCLNCGQKDVTTYPGNKDNTTTDKEIPKAGIQSIIIALVLIIGTVSVISIFKVNKYKDI